MNNKVLTGNSLCHLYFFLDLLKEGISFSLIRPNDGEYLILKENRFTNIDNWTYNGGSLSDDLLSGIKKASILENSFIGIPCKDCWDVEKTEWCINNYNLNSKNMTYGNLVCNKQWKIFINYIINNKVSFYYIGPGENKSQDLQVKDRFLTNLFLVNNWDTEKEKFLNDLSLWVESKVQNNKSCIFTFSVGPISKILIPYFFEKHPSHTFLDVGSSFDLFLKGHSNRGYLTENGPYSNIVCDFEKGHINE